MRLRVLAGLLGLGIALGGLLGLYFQDRDSTLPNDPLVDEYVRLVGVLYARGESLSVVEARLARLGYGDPAKLVRDVATRSAGSSDASANIAAGDLASVLVALAPSSDESPLSTPRVLASGRGAGPTPSPRAEQVLEVPTPVPEFPRPGRLATGKNEATLRTRASVDSPAIRIVRRDAEFTVLGVERGQAVEGAEDRWYRVRVGEYTGYIYYTLIERAS